ncbi:MAG: ADOP family duplicated permease [Gammaproteobacteria bacterium]|nr:ADOP family duplicated permease [Gammaproteobacteria bacterium]
MRTAFSHWVVECRQAVQSLARTPGLTATIVLTLGVGLGAATATHTLIKDIVLDPLGYPDAERLVMLRSEVPGAGTDAEWQGSFPQYYQFRDKARTLAGIGLYGTVGMNIESPSGVEHTQVTVASASVQELIGARAVLGRGLQAADNELAAPTIAVVSHGYWQRRFGGDPNIIGMTLPIQTGVFAQYFELTAPPYEIVGVLAPGVALPPSGHGGEPERPDIWLPMRLDPAARGPLAWSRLAKVAPDVSLRQAQAELDGLTRGLVDSYPDAYSEALFEKYGFRTRAHDLKSFMVGPIIRNLWLIHGCVVLLLLVAVVNGASLFLVRAEVRRAEIDVRVALGASRLAIFRHFAAYSALIALAAGLLGLLAGYWMVQWASLATPWRIPRMDEVALDGGVFAFLAGLSLVVALVLAGFCAWRVDATGTAHAGRGVRGTGRESQRLRAAMTVGQVALSLVLIVAAALFVESFRNLRATDTGIEAEGAVSIKTFHGEQDMSNWWPFVKQVLQRIEALPGVAVVGATTAVPFSRFTGHGCVQQGFDEPTVYQRVEAAGLTYCAAQAVATPGYFEAVGIPMLRGRGFTHADLDNPAEGVVVVSRAFAERFWPGENPLGKRVSPYGGSVYWYRVVGVAGDVFRGSVQEKPHNLIYYPLAPIPGDAGWYFGGIDFVVRTANGEPAAVVPRLRELIENIDPTVAVGEAWTMSALVNRSMARLSFTLVLISVAACTALGLAVVGLYGLVAYLVARRSSEIGVRVALGARPDQVRRIVVAGSAKLIATGLLIGVACSIAASATLRGLVFGVAPTDLRVYAIAIVVVTVATLGASWLAANRAVGITPMDALRTE